ncbi:MAG TPA: PEP-CTERM sorting domain-containing protein [Vicinamibacterales bacterium]|nr:PEP-CTERM sorting domain-containing protein [Vicinamibacterales bacterium]
MKWTSIVCGAIVSVALAAPAQADVIGTLNLDGGTQDVTVGLTFIDWGPAGPPSGTFDVSAFTNVTYGGGGTINTGDPGVILDLNAAMSFPINNFMTFPLDPLVDYSLSGIGPGSANTNCAGVTLIGQSCSPFIGSPFILTLSSTGTSVTLAAFGFAFDTFSVSTWTGSFTTHLVDVTPLEIQTFFGCTTGSTIATCTNQSNTISNSYLGTFSATAVPVPEPASLALLGLGLLGAGARVRWRRP